MTSRLDNKVFFLIKMNIFFIYIVVTMKRLMLYFLWLATFFVLSLPAFAQHSISGKVIDSEREPVVGAAVIPDGNIQKAVATDQNGFYTINVSNPNCILTFSALGFAPLEKAVNGATTIDVVLQIAAEEMEEVIKVAYGSQKKINLTGAVAQIGNKELKIAPSGNVSSLLSGKLPGLVTRQSSGQPGADGSSLYVRGVGAGDGQILVVLGNNQLVLAEQPAESEIKVLVGLQLCCLLQVLCVLSTFLIEGCPYSTCKCTYCLNHSF